MNANKALMLTSAISYAGGIAMTMAGRPPMIGVDPTGQIVMFAAIGSGLIIQVLKPNPLTKYGLAAFYGFFAPQAFTDYQRWAPTGSPIVGPAMCLWDLALAVALLTDK